LSQNTLVAGRDRETIAVWS